MRIEQEPGTEPEKQPETLGWSEEVALRVLGNTDKEYEKEIRAGQEKISKLPQKVTQIDKSLFENEKGEIVPFRTKDVVFIPSHDEKGIPARIFCIGDIHSDSTGEKKVIEEFTKALNNGENAYFISLGDYVDRPKKNVPSYASSFEKSEQLDCFHRIIQTKLEYPERVVTLGGNHEKDYRINSNCGFLSELTQISSDSINTHQQYLKVFQKLPNAAILVDQSPKKCHFFAHAGIPSQDVNSLNEFVEKSNDPGLYWSDPNPEKNSSSEDRKLSYRGGSIKQGTFYYNEKAVNDFFKAIGIDGKIIRGHETPDSGFKEDLNEKVTTIFSSPQYDGLNIEGKYIDYTVEKNHFDINGIGEDAKKLPSPKILKPSVPEVKIQPETKNNIEFKEKLEYWKTHCDPRDKKYFQRILLSGNPKDAFKGLTSKEAHEIMEIYLRKNEASELNDKDKSQLTKMRFTIYFKSIYMQVPEKHSKILKKIIDGFKSGKDEIELTDEENTIANHYLGELKKISVFEMI